jgi:Uma2 family endonuclease
MADPAKKIATYDDIEALPPNVVGEIIYGTLVTHPRPLPRHSVAHSGLNFELVGPFQRGRGGPGGWIFMTEPELHLGPHVIVPDLAGWKREKLTPFPTTSGIDVAPDWVCEILSDSTERYDRNEKRKIYAQVGVTYIWLLDPRIKVLECFTLVADNWLLTHTFDQTSKVSAPPFDAINFDLSALFPSTDLEGISE